MRKLTLILIASFVACVCFGKPYQKSIYIAMGDATAGTQTVENVKGYIDSIQVSASGTSSTGTVVIAIVPEDTNLDAINIATNSVTDESTWRIRVDSTDITGSDLTSDPPIRYLLTGDDLRLVISASTTGITWRATIRLDK